MEVRPERVHAGFTLRAQLTPLAPAIIALLLGHTDTDSIMILFPDLEPTDEVMEMLWDFMPMLMGSVTAQLREGPESAFKIETEATASRSLFVRQKKYAFKYQAKRKGAYKVKTRGLDLVRRDKPPILRKIQKRLLDLLMDRPAETVKRDVELALCGALNELCRRKCPLEDSVMTKELRDDYATPQVHAAVVAKQRERELGTEVQVGQRVLYVYIEGGAKEKRCDLSEDVAYVRAHPEECPIDREWYFGLVQRSLDDMLKSISPDAEEALFDRYRSCLKRQRAKTPSISAAFGAAEEDLSADAVLARAEQARKRRKAQAEPTTVISDARAAKAKAKSKALPAGQSILPF